MKKLTSSELTFQSFRHSQGSLGAQLRIFRFMDLAYGIQPDLHPVGPEFERFVGYMNGSASSGSPVSAKSHASSNALSPTSEEPRKNHIDVTKNGRLTTERAVYYAIKALRRNGQGTYNRQVQNQDSDTNVRLLAYNLLDTEARILDQEHPWSEYRSGATRDRSERVRARVLSGKSSFLYLYGRDGKPTGREEIDDMYQQAWQAIENDDFPWKYMRAKHELAVTDAELMTLGRTVLAADNSSA